MTFLHAQVMDGDEEDRSLPLTLLSYPDFPGIKHNRAFRDLWRRFVGVSLSSVMGPGDSMQHFRWSQNTVIEGRGEGKGSEACVLFVLQMTDSLHEESNWRSIFELDGSRDRQVFQREACEAVFRRRVASAVTEFDNRKASGTGCHVMQEAAGFAESAAVLSSHTCLEKSEITRWLKSVETRPALLCFTMPKGKAFDGDSLGNTFGVFLDTVGTALVFDSHHHFSNPSIDAPDLGMLVADFEEYSAEVLTTFICETIVPSSRCCDAKFQIDGVALVRPQPLPPSISISAKDLEQEVLCDHVDLDVEFVAGNAAEANAAAEPVSPSPPPDNNDEEAQTPGRAENSQVVSHEDQSPRSGSRLVDDSSATSKKGAQESNHNACKSLEKYFSRKAWRTSAEDFVSRTIAEHREMIQSRKSMMAAIRKTKDTSKQKEGKKRIEAMGRKIREYARVNDREGTFFELDNVASEVAEIDVQEEGLDKKERYHMQELIKIQEARTQLSVRKSDQVHAALTAAEDLHELIDHGGESHPVVLEEPDFHTEGRGSASRKRPAAANLEEPAGEDLTKKRLTELKAMCESHGLNKGGRKDVLINRLTSFYKANEETADS